LLLVMVVVPLMVLRFGVALLVGGAVLAHTATLFLRLFLRRYLLLYPGYAIVLRCANSSKQNKRGTVPFCPESWIKLLKKVSKSQMLCGNS
jgi:hypothetical protein